MPAPRTPVAGHRRYPVGAEPRGDGSVHVRVWAPAAREVTVVVTARGTDTAREVPLAFEEGGYFAGLVDARVGDTYRFRLDQSDRLLPDPASRFQPSGPHGPSEIIDAAAFRWTDHAWTGVRPVGQVIYELHVGTFTTAGTYATAAEQLPALAAVGITVIELMPLAEFEGRFGWGYDGVDLFAPSHLYGRPDDLRRFVDRAHGLGIGVILDVVYNHLGPVGNYLRQFSPSYFSRRYENEWGDALNFDDEDAGPVRDLFIANAAYWIDEFHVDGLRLDATQQIFDATDDHLVGAVTRAARAAAPGRSVYVVAENEPQQTRLVRPAAEGGYGVDALWNDDFHHAATVAMSGRGEAYYSDTTGSAQELIACAKYGYLFQGQHYHWQRRPRGSYGLDLPPHCFVTYLQNHDQVANSARGLRGHQLTSPAQWRAMTALWLLMPGTPMLFQGQEFSASAPFLYFADFDEALNTAVRRGRSEFLQQFPSVADFEQRGRIAEPSSPDTFRRSAIDHAERDAHAESYALHVDLLRLRREIQALQQPQRGGCDGTVLTPDALALRLFDGEPRAHRLVVTNLGSRFERPSVADPLVAPPDGLRWTLRWSSEHPAYGGGGTPDIWKAGTWCVPGRITLLFELSAGAGEPTPTVRRRTA